MGEPEVLETGAAAGRGKWAGICYARQSGKLYCAPFCHSDVLTIEPASGEVAFVQSGDSSSDKWLGIAEAQNGKLYCAPCVSSEVLVIDPAAGNRISFIPTGVTTAGWKWSGIVGASNGKLYCAPSTHSAVLVIDPTNGDVAFIETNEI